MDKQTFKGLVIFWFSIGTVLCFFSGGNPIYAIGGGIFAALALAVIPFVVLYIIDKISK
ncbi:hypothetical protein [Entomomonas moraniae]|uniref:hypothetical protein n=1 Tax=Entomomonas moraniae TaxID=2213226 RepID=UPI0013E008BF|nr:hypothetical protein [Entomomonas moraniae]